MLRPIITLALATAIGVPAANAGTPNTTAAGAVSYEVGAGWVTHSVDEANQNRWFMFTEVAGRSYCVEVALGVATYFSLDPSVTLYSDAGGTVVLYTNDNGVSEPPMTKGARVCYVSPLTPTASGAQPTGTRLFKANVPIVAGSGDSGFVRVRVIESTLWAEWFSVVVGSTDSSVHLVNSANVSITGTFFLTGWGPASSLSISRTSKSDRSLQSLMPGVSGAQTGQVFFAHTGPPGTVSGWVTVGNDRYYFYPR